MKITAFTVLPDTPAKLRHLNELAFNLYFSWNPGVLELFQRLDPGCWEDSGNNPARQLCLVSQERLNAAAADPTFLADLKAVYKQYQNYLREPTWYDREVLKVSHLKPASDAKPPTVQIAYFCAEFGLHNCLPTYSGGLGVLSGEVMKAASDLGLPLVGVGLLYRRGYFRQYLNAEGMQQEHYPELDWYSMPVQLVKAKNGAPLKSSIMLGAEEVKFQIWRVAVGRTCIYLLDTNVEENEAEHRDITKVLYDPNREKRISQELVLGIGGVQALHLMGVNPSVYHVSEGHAAFLLFARLRLLMSEHGLSYTEAREVVWASTVFTAHTPVPAGNERFSAERMEHYLADYVKDLGLEWKEFMALGRENAEDQDEKFCMTVLALRLAAYANGVSKLHGEICRKMWRGLYPGIPEAEIPITHVTNGVHVRSWLAPEMLALFQRHSGAEDLSEVADSGLWKNIERIPNAEFWHLRETQRRQFVEYARERATEQLLRRGARAGELSRVRELLDPKALTIGFARRFTTYKRAYLFLMNPERLRQILCHPQYPVQIVFAGKAHPADYSAKDIIKRIFELSHQPEFRKHILFLEDYDLEVARRLVQGVDVWLSNPRRPLEACGTSGMKAALNGCLNFSVLDGWWAQAYDNELGWAIGQGETFTDYELQDRIESELFYGALEREIVPMFYSRDAGGVPHDWVGMMKESIVRLSAAYNSHHMLKAYTNQFYRRALELGHQLRANEFTQAKALAAWRQKLTRAWAGLEILQVESPASDYVYKGSQLEVRATVKLNGLAPEDLIVECNHGPLGGETANSPAHPPPDQENSRTGESREIGTSLAAPERVRMELETVTGDTAIFHTAIPCSRGGHYGYTVRLLPGHPLLATEFLPGLIHWFE